MKLIKPFVFFTLAVTLAACGAAPATPEATAIPTVTASDVIVSEGRLEPIHYTNLALNANGLISEVLVTEGDEVSAGDVIARIESSEAQSLETAQAKAAQELTAAYQEVRDTQYKLDNFDIPNDFKDKTPTAALQETLDALNKARADFEPYKNINERNLQLTQAEKNGDVYRGTAKTYKKVLDDAWANYRKAIQWMELQSNFNTAQSRLLQAQKDYDALNDLAFSSDTAGIRAALANADVRAPFPGIITDLDLKTGEFAALGQKAITLADMSNWVVKTTDLTEIDVVNIKEGQGAVIKLDAISGKEFNGNVLSIAQNYSETQGDVVYEVTILLTETDPAMRWGMTAEVSFSE